MSLSREQEAALCVAGNREALIVAHFDLARGVARRFRRTGVPLDDLIQEARLGLIFAAAKFDHTRGFRFLTYARRWCVVRCQRRVHADARIVKLPEHVKAYDAIRMLRCGEAMDATDLVAAGFGEGFAADVFAAWSASHANVEPTRHDTPEDAYARAESDYETADAVRAAMARLTAKERTIVRQRFMSEERVGMKEIGAELGVSKQRVNLLEKRAMEKLRGMLAA